jgi:hypothetical protein
VRGELDEILAVYVSDNASAWDCGSDGVYVRREPAAGEPRRAAQEIFTRRAIARAAADGNVGGEDGARAGQAAEPGAPRARSLRGAKERRSRRATSPRLAQEL